MKHYFKVGESQIPQILCFAIGLVMTFMFNVAHDGLYAIISLLMTQIGIVFMGCYDEREDEKKANAEAIAMLDEN